MNGPVLLLGFVTAQRLVELVIARSNTRALLARGAIEHGAGHYPVIVAFHAVWLAGLWIVVLQDGASGRVLWWPAVLAFALLQVGRIWILATLGRRWTTRILVMPGETLVARGPYRWLSHPNYAVVAGEIAAVPLALGLPGYAVLASVLHAAVLWIRVGTENRALGRS
jgi:methyltransferase